MVLRNIRLVCLSGVFFLASALPSHAADEGGGFQSWLFEHRTLLRELLVAQIVVFAGLLAWELAFQRQQKTMPGAGAETWNEDRKGDTLGLSDPFKTRVTTRRSTSGSGESSTVRKPRPPAAPPQAEDGEDAPPPQSQLSSPPAPASPAMPPSPPELPTTRGARRLERIEGAEGDGEVARPAKRAAFTPPPPRLETGADSWADAMRRAARETSERAPRRPAQIPPPSVKAPEHPVVPPPAQQAPASSLEASPEAASEVARPGLRTIRVGVREAAPSAPEQVPAPPSPPASGQIAVPAGFSRYAWDHALRLLERAATTPCRLAAGCGGGVTVGEGSATLNLVTPPPAAAEKRRGRGMKLSSGGETRLGETLEKSTPARSSQAGPGRVPGFAGVLPSHDDATEEAEEADATPANATRPLTPSTPPALPPVPGRRTIDLQVRRPGAPAAKPDETSQEENP
ncbi:MAG: hypothetical protein EB084_06435 [Proteobacteria bacterium]|nr:hypothetical protein [Pseudomonadota bacterium]